MSNDPTSSSPPTASEPPPLPPPLTPPYASPPSASPPPLAYAVAWPEKRLHPATIVVQVVRFVKSIALVLAFALYGRFTGGGSDTIELVAAALGGLGILGAVLKYATTTYAIRDGALHLRTGLLVRQHRVVPLERIQNINQKQELVHRLLGVVDVRVETASGGGAAEVELSVVTLAEADLLRADLSRRTAAPAADGTADGATPAAGEVVYRATLADLALAGATTNRLGTLLAAAIGLAATLHAYSGRDASLGRTVQQQAGRFAIPGWTTVVGVVAGLVLLGWLASIALTVVGKYGFTLVRVRGQLERSFGLVTRHQSVFPVGRVQMLRIGAPLIQRKLGLCHINAETAGSFREEGGGGDAGTSELCPILRARDAAAMCRLALPAFALDAVRWTPTSPLARRRAFARYCVTAAIVVAAVAWLSASPAAWPALAAVPVAAWFGARAYYRSIGYDLSDRYLAVKSGVLTQAIRVVPLSKVQASFVAQSPLQRRLGLATVTVLTAGGSMANRAGVPDLAWADARTLQEALHSTRAKDATDAKSSPPEHPALTPGPV